MSSKNPLLAFMAAVTCFLEFVRTVLEETDNWVPYMEDLLNAAAARAEVGALADTLWVGRTTVVFLMMSKAIFKRAAC